MWIKGVFLRFSVSRWPRTTEEKMAVSKDLWQLDVDESELTVDDVKEKLLFIEKNTEKETELQMFASKNYDAEKAKTWLLQTLWRVGAKGDNAAELSATGMPFFIRCLMHEVGFDLPKMAPTMQFIL